MYRYVRLAQDVAVPPTTTQPPVTPAPAVVGPVPVATPGYVAPAAPYGVPWGWIIGGAVAIGAAALLISAVSAPARR
jgi:hypothetical protein